MELSKRLTNLELKGAIRLINRLVGFVVVQLTRNHIL